MDAPYYNGEPGARTCDPERRPKAEWEQDDLPAGACQRPGCDRSLNFFSVTIAGVGQFCSRQCADKVQMEHETMAFDGEGRR